MSDFDIAASAAPAKEKEDLGAAFIATNKKVQVHTICLEQ